MTPAERRAQYVTQELLYGLGYRTTEANFHCYVRPAKHEGALLYFIWADPLPIEGRPGAAGIYTLRANLCLPDGRTVELRVPITTLGDLEAGDALIERAFWLFGCLPWEGGTLGPLTQIANVPL